jgi:hypothetical protein
MKLFDNSASPRLRRRPGAFLKGPVPINWLLRAMALPGRALHVAVLLWWKAGCERKKTVHFPLSRGAEGGLDRHATRRGLRALADAGLVSLRHQPNQAWDVTLLEIPEQRKDVP